MIAAWFAEHSGYRPPPRDLYSQPKQSRFQKSAQPPPAVFPTSFPEAQVAPVGLSGGGTPSSVQRSRKCAFDAGASLRVLACHGEMNDLGAIVLG